MAPLYGHVKCLFFSTNKVSSLDLVGGVIVNILPLRMLRCLVTKLFIFVKKKFFKDSYLFLTQVFYVPLVIK